MSALREAARQMAEDYQTSEKHHPDHALVRKDAFERLLAAIPRRWEVNFAPSKRKVDGVHQPDVAYIVPAETPAKALAAATAMLKADHSAAYRMTSVREVPA